MGRRTHADWGDTQELLALLAEIVDYGNRNFYAAHSKRGTRQPDPLHVPRPWDRPIKPRRKATAEDIRAMFSGPIIHTTEGE